MNASRNDSDVKFPTYLNFSTVNQSDAAFIPMECAFGPRKHEASDKLDEWKIGSKRCAKPSNELANLARQNSGLIVQKLEIK